MSLQNKIEQEIRFWEERIQQKQLNINRMKLKIKELRHLLDMAKVVEGLER